jgi:hypothetical protein
MVYSNSAPNVNSITNTRCELGGVGGGRAGDDNGYSVLVWKLEGKTLLTKPRRRRQDIKNTGRV